MLLLDNSLPFVDVFEAVRRVRACAPHTAILLLADKLNPAEMQALLKLGVLGFVCKEEPLRDTLFAGIRRVKEGKIHFSPEAALIGKLYDTAAPLSERQVQVLERIARGLHIQQIALELDISARAVYAARARVREALGVTTDAQLGVEALRRGLLDE